MEPNDPVTESVFRAFFENAVEGMFLSTPAGQFVRANRALARMLGYLSPDELLARVRDIDEQLYVDPARRPEFKRLLAERGSVSAFECKLRRADGSIATVVISARSVKEASGEVRWYEGTVEDISEQRHLEEQVRQKQKMEAIGQLAAAVAHDFNNLLTVILSQSALLAGEADYPAEVQVVAEEIRQASLRAASLTRQLLAFSRQEIVEPRPLQLAGVVHEIERMVRRLVGENIALEATLAADAGWIVADAGQVEQILVNLVVNARDAMPGGGRLAVTVGNVELDEAFAQKRSEVVPGSYVRLTVTDTGIGILPEMVPRLFEPFFTTKAVGKGTGLGLATVYGLVKQNKGYIYVRTGLGKGTAFDVYFPRVEAPRTEAAAPAAELAPEPQASGTVLLVDDDDGVRSLARVMLERAGYTVLAVRDGLEALELARQYQGPIGLLVADVGLPGPSGEEVAERIRGERPDMGVVLITGYAAAETSQRHTTSFGGCVCLGKPFTSKALLKALATARAGS